MLSGFAVFPRPVSKIIRAAPHASAALRPAAELPLGKEKRMQRQLEQASAAVAKLPDTWVGPGGRLAVFRVSGQSGIQVNAC